jgi:hypothetical protein
VLSDFLTKNSIATTYVEVKFNVDSLEINTGFRIVSSGVLCKGSSAQLNRVEVEVEVNLPTLYWVSASCCACNNE